MSRKRKEIYKDYQIELVIKPCNKSCREEHINILIYKEKNQGNGLINEACNDYPWLEGSTDTIDTYWEKKAFSF